MSLFCGKYYLNEYRKECADNNYGSLLTCNLYEIERNNLANKKVVLDNIKSNEIVVMADEKNVWLQKISRNYKPYNTKKMTLFTKVFIQIILKSMPKEKDKIEQKSDISANITFEQNKELVGFSFSRPLVLNAFLSYKCQKLN